MSLDAATELQPQDLVVTLLGAYVRREPRPIWSGGLVELLGELGFSRGAARIALTRLVGRGLLERERNGRFVSYVMTPRCAELLAEGDERIFTLGQADEWDGRWTLVWYSIDDDRRVERQRLARRLRFLGFGPLEDSTWIAPRDHRAEVARVADQLGVAGRYAAFLSELAPDADPQAIVARAWDIDRLAARYAGFVEQFRPYRRRKLSEPEAFRVRTTMTSVFRTLPSLDPDLPDAFAPEGWQRHTAIDLFHTLYQRLQPAAQRYFDTTIADPVARS